jgi:ubiquinone biosynthesis protein
MSLASLPKTIKTMARLRVIAQVLTKHGFGHFVDRLQLGQYVPSFLKFRRDRSTDGAMEIDPLAAIGNRLVSVCEQLGPTFIKLGQIASTRPDLLPAQIIHALEHLQDEVQPFPVDQARRLIEESIETPLGDAFRDFNDEPFASGSIGQVHRATTSDGQKVVVKVKRPGIDQVVQLDIYVLKWMAERAEYFFPELRPYRPKVIVDEFAQTIQHELDFINEASATSRFHEAFKDDTKIFTPAVRWDLTGVNVLTLEYMDGLHLRDALGEKRNICDHKALAHNLAECFLKQFFELGLFHADPHPGNLLFRAPDQLVLFDFGMIGQIDDELTGRLVIGIVAAVKRETDILIEVLADLGSLGRDTDRSVLNRDLANLLNKYYGLPIRRLEVGTILTELIETVRRNDVTLPRDFVAMFKALGTVSGVVLQLDPELNLLELLQPRLNKLLRERFSPGRIARLTGISAWHVANILRDAPRLLRDTLRGIGRGQFQINIRHENLDHLASELDRSSNRLAFSVLIASTIIGSTMLLSMATEVKLFGSLPIRYLGFVGYTLTFFMGAWLLIAILRSGKMS